MNTPKCSAIDDITFLVAAPRAVSGTEAARVPPPRPDSPAHDAFTRLLHRLEPDPDTLWRESAPRVERGRGIRVVDDATRDTPAARRIDRVTRHGSGKHHAVVAGITLITLLWSAGERLIPCDDRIDEKQADGLSKNDHCRAMLTTAQARGFAPECIVFDRWYGSLDNRKRIRGFGWRWLTQRKTNRRVDPDGTGNRAVERCVIAETGTAVQLEGDGFVRVFLIVTPDGDREDWATSDRGMGARERLKYAAFAWGIAVYQRGWKQECGVARAMVRAARAQRHHSGCAMRAFLRFAQHRLVTGVSWWAAKTEIIRHAVRSYRAHPRYTLSSTA